MKIAITGATGFVGSYLVKEFSKKYDTIFAFNRKVEKQEKNIFYKKWELLECFEETLDFDVFIHSAADTNYEKSKQKMGEEAEKINKNVLDFINKSNCKHCIYISSSSVYQGISGDISTDVKINEKNLKNSYSFTKYFSEKYIQNHLRKDIKLTILRPRAIYGEGDRVLVPNILKHQIFGKIILPGNGKIQTSLTEIHYFVGEIEKTIIEKKYGIYNISSEVDSYENIFGKIAEEYKLKGIIKVPIWIFKLLAFFNENKYSYIIDTFENDKILI